MLDSTVLHHTDCGLTKATEDQAIAAAETGGQGKIDGRFHFHTFLASDIDKSVRDDVEFLRGEKLVPEDTPIAGGILDLETGKIRFIDV